MLAALAAVAAKLTSIGAAAQAATGLGIALASVTGAGALGVLPAPVQDRVSAVVEAATPFDLPDSADASSATEKPTAPVDAPQDPATVEIPDQADFGISVSDDASDGGLGERDVSTEAREIHQPETPDAPTSVPVPAPRAPQQPQTGQPETVPPSAPGAPAADRVPDEAGRP